MSAKLIPVDQMRCQAEYKEGSFMTLGPRTMQRCTAAPAWLAVEIKDGKLIGAMALCDACKQVCAKQMPDVQYWSFSPAAEETK